MNLRHLVPPPQLWGCVLLLVVGAGAGCSSPSNEAVRIDPAASGSPATAASASAPLEAAAVEFLREAVGERRFNIAVARLAARRATTAALREYARSIIGQQDLLLDRLSGIADQYRVQLPPGLKDEQRETLLHLRELERDDFDREFLQAVIAGRRRQAQAFEFASTLANAEIRTLGVEFAPTMESEIAEAEDRLQRLSR